jgi:MFS family permease
VGLLLMHVERVIRLRDSSPLEHIIEGFQYVRRTLPIRDLLLMLGLISLVGMPYSVLMPIFADKILHSGARGLGILMGATGVGALIGALMLAAKSGIRGLGRWVAVSAAAFGVTLILFSWSHSLWLSTLMLVPVGMTMMVEMAASNTLIQAMVADELRGRVMAVYSMMFMGMAPLGALFAGALADRLGAPLTVSVGAVACLAGAAVFWKRLPALRVEARQLIIAQAAAGGEPAEQATGRFLFQTQRTQKP